ncbi:hypothetical protein [Streptomyces cucumeris]|uniref:hypothetical protein n=1 Tax=Streptomyces cucumeris TaxID=2962890 RepID=UPI0020C8564F|nr:hypothetical protein [Streptomyces sp. NEAU-Y11]MCP9209558.1 hypothetical protein [Streptomyces sp. NEAU-Y11]
MTKNGRKTHDLLVEWLRNDHPVNYAARVTVTVNRNYSTDYGEGLRDVVTDALYLPEGYLRLCQSLASDKPQSYPNGYPCEPGAMEWTRDQITRDEWDALDWSALARDTFPGVFDGTDNED